MVNLTKSFSCFAFTFVLVMTGASAQQQHSYVADANREYKAIFSHTKNPCVTKESTLSYAECIGGEVIFTETHLAKFLTAIRGIASQDDAGTAKTASPRRTSELALVNRADSAWRQYRKNVCDLTAAGMAGGSGEGNAAADCLYEMDRKYAQQLADAVYLTTLAE